MRRLSVTETNKNEECSVVVTSAPPGGNAEHNAQSVEYHSHDSETCLTGDIQVELVADHTVNDTDNSKEHELTPVSTQNEYIEGKTDTRDTSKKLESKEQIVENFKELIQQLAEDKDDNDMAKLQEEISAKPVEQIFEETQDIPKIQGSLENKQDTETEPVNGDITKELFPSDMMEALELANETLDTESNLEPADTDEKSLTTLVSVSMDLEKSLKIHLLIRF
ncbi:Hypothetical predicted protein [Pelobates cultripes]|uniref:Uncharacterized protein n=1 Tax=Pelobates cultripes TaxID=61616 RepID=A0AAD1WVJ9_PELCU|nr:Hypothetical predicted protein [Pelobates cultripes]